MLAFNSPIGEMLAFNSPIGEMLASDWPMGDILAYHQRYSCFKHGNYSTNYCWVLRDLPLGTVRFFQTPNPTNFFASSL